MMSIVSFSVFADEKIELDNDPLLMVSCHALTITPEHENAKPCIYFIQGFLAAVQAIDQPIIDQQTMKTTRFHGFMSRSYRNREQAPPTRSFPFCVADDESKTRVIKIVSKQLPQNRDGKNTKMNIHSLYHRYSPYHDLMTHSQIAGY